MMSTTTLKRTLPIVRLLVTLLALPLAASAAAAGGGTPQDVVIYDSGGAIYHHTLAAPQVLELIGPVATPTGQIIGGCETIEDSELLYCIEAAEAATFFTIDPTDASLETIGTANAGTFSVFTSLAVHPTTGIFYAAVVDPLGNTSRLYTIDQTTGSETLVGPIASTLITALAFDASGQLYAYDVDSENLFGVDETTGIAIPIGPTGFESEVNVSLDFSDQDVCYLWGRNTMGVNEIRTCNPSTGATTPFGEVGTTSPGGGLSLTGAAFVRLTIFADGFESGDTMAWD